MIDIGTSGDQETADSKQATRRPPNTHLNKGLDRPADLGNRRREGERERPADGTRPLHSTAAAAAAICCRHRRRRPTRRQRRGRVTGNHPRGVEVKGIVTLHALVGGRVLEGDRLPHRVFKHALKVGDRSGQQGAEEQLARLLCVALCVARRGVAGPVVRSNERFVKTQRTSRNRAKTTSLAQTGSAYLTRNPAEQPPPPTSPHTPPLSPPFPFKATHRGWRAGWRRKIRARPASARTK